MTKKLLTHCLALALLGTTLPALAFQQFPYDIPIIGLDWANDGAATGTVPPLIGLPGVPAAVSMHMAAGDGYTKMADGTGLYTFGFSDGSNVPANQFMMDRDFKAEFPAPTISYYEGQEFYLTLTNVGMKLRPDLFDPHSVHFHGFPQAAPVFDGEPMASFGIRMSFDLTYYYNLVEPGTYMYHCHVEATEHMEMGMLGNLYVKPRQDLYAQINGPINGFSSFAYNDCDNLPPYNADKTAFEAPTGALSGLLCGMTGYDVEKAIQFSDFDADFHKLHINADVLPFADMRSSHYMFNGRGYPDTVGGPVTNNAFAEVGQPDYVSQPIDSRVTSNPGQRVILLRLSNLSIQNFATLEFNGPAFKVVGKCAKLLRGPDGKDLSYSANSVLIGPGETFDVILDTTGWLPGTYYFFSRNLNQLNNDLMDRSGAMTEIIVN